MGGLGGFKDAKMYARAVDSNDRCEAASVSVSADAKKSCAAVGVRATLVLRVERKRGLAQIRPPVVATNAIYVIDMLGRPRTSHVEER